MKTSLLTIFLLTVALASAQIPTPSASTDQPRMRRTPPVPNPVRTTAGSSNRAGSDAGGLERNVTLAFKGALPGSGEIDLELTGSGPKFSSDLVQPPGDDPSLPVPVIVVNATVTERDGQYRVEYRVGVRVAVPTRTMQAGEGRITRNIEYRDIGTTGSALTEPGKPVTITKANGKALTLTLSLPE